MNFIFVCKPDSHPELYRWIDFLAANGQVPQFSLRNWNGRFAEIYTYRYALQVPLRGGEDALQVNWCEIQVSCEDTGQLLYQNAFIIHHLISETNVQDIVRAGRARWKIENKNNNVLKTKGYHLEHNFGHGTQSLSALLLSLNLLAFIFQTSLDWTDARYKQLRIILTTRETFFDDLCALTRYLYFDSWEHLLDFMLAKLHPDTS